MNKIEADVLNTVAKKGFHSQRQIAEESGISLGAANRAMNALREGGYLTADQMLTSGAKSALSDTRPKNAIILAAGFGLRMIPINREVPKGLLEVQGELLIERLIRQLKEAGIEEIYMVVGFMKEAYECLIDLYGVKLVINPDYATSNNLRSLLRVAGQIGNSYILPCDLWCEENPFLHNTLYSWYMLTDEMDEESRIRIKRDQRLQKTRANTAGNRLVGIAYIREAEADALRDRMEEMAKNGGIEHCFWEDALFSLPDLEVYGNMVAREDVIEINTYEQLRELDAGSNSLHSVELDAIAKVFSVQKSAISEIQMLKKGMTNRSFLFSCKGVKYIMRIPGEGTEQLIDRENEAAVYEAIRGKGLCDDVVYIDPKSGYKITRYLEGVRVCDAEDESDLIKCMRRLRSFHEMKLKVPHRFRLFEKIDEYEALWEGRSSVFRDYEDTKKRVFSLRAFIDGMEKEDCLTHIDAVPDNFLFHLDENGDEQLQLTDWEYAGMQDPHVDIAMFCIYSLYEKEQIDKLIDLYFERACPAAVRTKIYAYMAACGLLWSNWCEYKRFFGVEFGEYSLRQYRYAKEFSKIVKESIEQGGKL